MDNKKDKIYDVGIIGAGPAGMTAAIYAGRANKSVIILDKEGYGGQIARSPIVENIPGFDQIIGMDFATKMFMQFSSYPNIAFKIAEVRCLTYNHGLITLCCDNEVNYFCKTLIVATGLTPKTLNLPTTDLYYCVTCDGPKFKNKTVVVAGSGNTGATFALELATYCKKVYITDITTDLCCEPVLQTKILETANIQWLPNCSIQQVKTSANNRLKAVTLSTNDTIQSTAIFVATGMQPNSEFLKDFVDLDKHGYIIAGENCLNNKVPNIFIAGDCRQKNTRQVATAIGDGATAAVAAIKYLNIA